MVPLTLTNTSPSFLALLTRPLRTRLSLQLEILALRHQLTVYQRAQPREMRRVEAGEVIEVREVGGRHHHYERRAG